MLPFQVKIRWTFKSVSGLQAVPKILSKVAVFVKQEGIMYFYPIPKKGFRRRTSTAGKLQLYLVL